MTIISVTLDEIENYTTIALEKHGALSWVAKEVAKAVRVAEAENNKICGLYYLDSYCKQLKSGRVNGQIDPKVTRNCQGSNAVPPDSDPAAPTTSISELNKRAL